jgi:hypothetical protein
LDGRLDDDAWADAMPAAGFRQFEPDPGEPATERTEARIVYDDAALYVGMRMYDSAPDSIRAQFVRRDDFEAVSDWAHVFLDSYYDRRTAFHFATTPTGTRVDILHLEDTERDAAWDAVWEVATHIDEEGWTAEFRIPLSQLRFGGGAQMTWGVNFMRQIARRSEVSYWAPIPPEAGRLVSLFGDLTGLADLKAPGRLELLPYTVARLDRERVDPGNPFRGQNDYSGSGGLDFKYGLTSDLTLTGTLNPDFGQVEADPSVVNLGTTETIYPEKRPFFTEGMEIFRFPIQPEGDAFYSRRVGRPPQIGADVPSEGFADEPETAKIIGAMKLSGKTASGWSIGAMHAVTGRSEARISDGNSEWEQPVEPLTQYSMVRLLKDFAEGRRGIGVIGTGVFRHNDAEEFNILHSSALASGVNGWYRFGRSRYQLRGWVLGSHVRGSEEALIRTQRSWVHMYQRPDADHLTVDSSRTTLSGYAGEMFLEKIGGGHWTFWVGGGIRSPGIETNDVGYMSYSDLWWAGSLARYRDFTPGDVLRNWYVEGQVVLARTLGGEIVRPSLHLRMRGQLLNFWAATLNIDRWESHLWPSELRGGPMLRRQGYVNARGIVTSDTRKSWRLQLRARYEIEDGIDSDLLTLDPVFTIRPTSRATISLSPKVTWNRNPDQYVAGASRSDGGDREYIMAGLQQTTVGLTLRLSYSFTPDLAFDFYGQPFLSSGEYSDFLRVAEPRAKSFADRFGSIDPATMELADGRYYVDENGDGEPEYSFRNRDFNVRELNTNAVLRWEYKPGSTLFVVWSHAREDDLLTGRFDFDADIDRLFSAPATNVFMVKLSYWLGF